MINKYKEFEDFVEYKIKRINEIEEDISKCKNEINNSKQYLDLKSNWGVNDDGSVGYPDEVCLSNGNKYKVNKKNNKLFNKKISENEMKLKDDFLRLEFYKKL